MPETTGSLIGQPYFEQARGMLMEVCGCTAYRAATFIDEAAIRTGYSNQELVALLHAAPSGAAVLRLLLQPRRPSE